MVILLQTAQSETAASHQFHRVLPDRLRQFFRSLGLGVAHYGYEVVSPSNHQRLELLNENFNGLCSILTLPRLEFAVVDKLVSVVVTVVFPIGVAVIFDLAKISAIG